MAAAGAEGDRGASLGEAALFAGGLAALFVAVLAATGSFAIVTRAPWADEVDTLVFAADPSLGHALRGLAKGYDAAPPVVHTWLWLVTRLFPVTAATLRVPGFLAVLAGWGATYATLRFAYGRLVAASAVLTTLPAILLLYHCFEARFYGYWFGAAALVAYLVARRQSGASRRSPFILAAASLLLGTVHYFGVVSLGLIACAELAAGPSSLRDRVRRVAPMAVGVAGFVATVPFFLAQRRSYTIASWMPKPSLGVFIEFLHPLVTWPARLLACAVVVAAASAALQRGRGAAPHRPTADEAASLRRVAPLAALALAPLVFVAVSLLLLPAVSPRYGIVFFAGAPAFAAFVLARSHRAGAALVGAAAVAVFAHNLPKLAVVDRAFDDQAARFAALAVAGAPSPLVFQRPFYTYPLWATHPELRDDVFTWDFDRAASAYPFNEIDIFARDLNHALLAASDAPKMRPIDDLDRGGPFVWVTSSPPERNSVLFPRHDCVATDRAEGIFDPGALYVREPLVVYRCAPLLAKGP